ncbi:hypothetical protein WJX77_003282 [Trebouxia sp. C0004]
MRYLKLQDVPGDAAPVDLISLDLSFISVPKPRLLTTVRRQPQNVLNDTLILRGVTMLLPSTTILLLEVLSGTPRSDESSGSFAFVMTKQSFWAMSCQAHECLQEQAFRGLGVRRANTLEGAEPVLPCQ